MVRWFTAIRVRLRDLRQSTFFMNAFYLMLSTFIVAGFGFIFWVIVARGYSSTTIGLATTLLSVSGLLSMLSLAGFDTTFVRFLPKSKRPNDHINNGLVVVALLGVVLSLGFVSTLSVTSPSLIFVQHNGWYIFGFTFFTVATSLNVLTNAIFLAQKRVRDIFIINLLFSAFKVVLPLLIIHGSVMTIFVMVGISQLVGLVLSLGVMKVRFQYTFSPKIHGDIMRLTRKYSFSVYASSILNLLPPTILPLIIIHRLGSSSAAYYYIVFTIGSALYTIAYASMQSAFAEGSHNEAAMRNHILKATKLIGVLLAPAIVVVLAFSNVILKIFGSEYATGGSGLLRLFAISAVAVAACSALGAIFKVTHNLRGVVAMNIVYAAGILGLSYVFIPKFGILGVGWAWIAGTIAAAMVGWAFLKRSNSNYKLREG